MNYAEFITMLSNFQLASFNVGFEMAKNNNTKELEEQVSDMFNNIINYIKTNTKEN